MRKAGEVIAYRGEYLGYPMMTLLQCIKQSAAYRSRSEDLLRQGAEPQPQYPGLHLYRLLDCAAAAVVLEDNVLAQRYLRRFIRQGLVTEKEETTFKAEFRDAQAGFHEVSEPYFHTWANVLNLELALGCTTRLEARPSLLELAELAGGDGDGGCLGHESYLIELALGRGRPVETIRAERWAQWLADELVYEGDRGWQLAIAMGQGRPQDFNTLLHQYINQEQEKALTHGPYGHHFAPKVLGLEAMAVLRTAQQCQVPFPPEVLSNFGLAELISKGEFAWK